MMDSLRISGLILFLVLVVQCHGKTEIGDYIVDCSACQHTPLVGVRSFSCSVRCSAEGYVNTNLTTLYDMLTKMSHQLETVTGNLESVTKELEETKKKLNQTEEKLKIDVTFSVQLSSQTTFNNNQKVIFDNVISNVGNGYDNVTGIFTVPHNGSYELTLRNMGNSGGIYTYIVLDNVLQCTAHGAGTNQQGMCTIRKKLVEGDQILVRNGVNMRQYNSHYNSLSGHLIHLD